MDASLIFTPAQTILVWTLLSLLLIWMVTFTVLALHSHHTSDLEQLSTSSAPLSAIRVEPQVQVLAFTTSVESSPGATIAAINDGHPRIGATSPSILHVLRAEQRYNS